MDVLRIKGGCVLPSRHSVGEKLRTYSFDGGVTDSEGNFVEESMLHEPPCSVGGSYETTLRTDHSTAIYIGYLLDVWGHAITDGLKKLWFLRTDEGKEMIANGAKVVYVTLHNKPIPSWQLEIWRLAGHNCSGWVHVTEGTRFDEIIIPQNNLVASANETRHYDERFTYEINAIKSNALASVTTIGTNKHSIYFTRTKLKDHKDFNEKSLELFFKRLGYEIIAPETLPVKEQIALWAGCECAAATEGSIAHMAMFMNKDSNLLILRKANYFNGYQEAVNKISGANVTYMNANHSSRTSKSMPWAGPFYLCVTPELAHWAGIKKEMSPVWLRPSYWRYCIQSINLFQRIKDEIYILYKCSCAFISKESIRRTHS